MGLANILKNEFSFIKGNYLILIVSWILMDIGMEMPLPYYQQYVDALGGNMFPIALGIIGFANFFVMAFVAVPGGFLADKFGRRWLITTMTFGIALSYLFFIAAPFWQLTQSWHLILIGTIIQSLCLIYQPALFALVQDSLPPERRGVGSSIINIILGMSLKSRVIEQSYKRVTHCRSACADNIERSCRIRTYELDKYFLFITQITGCSGVKQ